MVCCIRSAWQKTGAETWSAMHILNIYKSNVTTQLF